MWVAHLQQNGFTVVDDIVFNPQINEQRAAHNIGPDLVGCHHAEADGYMIEGHVPAQDIARMVRSEADFAGISVPGMPPGSPGMTGTGSFRVLAFDDEGKIVEVYARY